MKMKAPSKKSVVGCLQTNTLTLATMGGVLAGVILGACLRTREEPWSPRESMYVSFVGDLFLRMLKSVILPLIIPSLIASVGSLDLGLSGRVGGRAVAYYMITTVFAVILGIVLVSSIRPGVGTEEVSEDKLPKKQNLTTADTMMDLIRNCFPPNVMQATTQQYKTTLIYPGTDGIKFDEKTNRTINGTDKDTWDVKGEWRNNTNILGLVVFSLVTGFAITAAGEEGKPLLKFFVSISAVMMRVTTWIIYLAPVGVCFLIAGQILEMTSFEDTFKKLGLYFATVLIGLFVHGLIVLPTLFALITRKLPFEFVANMGNALTTAFGTASSSATLPVTMESLEVKNGVDPLISRFVLPIGATINMDGTALYEAIAAIFIAQVRGISLSAGNIIAISITATAASIGAAGIPQAGLVTMVMVLDTVGLPADDVALILAIDWLLDRFRTAINVLGDSIGAGIVYHLSREDLKEIHGRKNAAAIENGGSGGSSKGEEASKSNGTENGGYETTPM